MKEPNDKDMLFDYLEGSLTPEQARLFEERMAQDESLRAEVEAQRKLDRLLESSAPATPPPDLRRNIRLQLEREVFTPRMAMQGRLYRLAQIAAVVAVLLVGLQVYRMMRLDGREADDSQYKETVAELDSEIEGQATEEPKAVALVTPLPTIKQPVEEPVETPQAEIAVAEAVAPVITPQETPVQIADADLATQELNRQTEERARLDAAKDRALQAERERQDALDAARAERERQIATARLTPTPEPPAVAPLFAETPPAGTPEAVRIEPLPSIPEPTATPGFTYRVETPVARSTPSPSPSEYFAVTPAYPAEIARPVTPPSGSSKSGSSMADRFRRIPGVAVTEEPATAIGEPAAAPAARTFAKAEPSSDRQPELKSPALRTIVRQQEADQTAGTAAYGESKAAKAVLGRELYQIPKADGAVALIARKRTSESDQQTVNRVEEDVQQVLKQIGGRVERVRSRTLPEDGRLVHEITATVPSTQADRFVTQLQERAGYRYQRSLNDNSIGRILEKGESGAPSTSNGIAFYERRAIAPKLTPVASAGDQGSIPGSTRSFAPSQGRSEVRPSATPQNLTLTVRIVTMPQR